MRRLKSLLILIIPILFAAACHPVPTPKSDPQTSREGRAVLGAASDFDPALLAALDEHELAQSWVLQNQASVSLWNDLNRQAGRGNASFVRWQSWYSKEDLQRVFRTAYQAIGVEARQARRAFTAKEIEDALDYHDRQQFLAADWNLQAFERWLKKYEAEGKANAIPGMNKVLMNRTALVAILGQYRAIDACARLLGQSMPCKDLQMRFPRGAAFLKTAWRRGQVEGDFEVPLFQTDDLTLQFMADEWQSRSSGIPSTVGAMRMETPTDQVFHLVGVHLTLKLDTLWLWTSHWLDAGVGEASYQSCSTLGFEPLARAENGGFEYEVNKAEALTGHSWCSNPYLEGGIQNHKTNCVGCHQHAATPWTEADFTERLTNELELLQGNAGIRSRSDQVWSLLNGPEPLVSFITQEIDYFDVYDL